VYQTFFGGGFMEYPNVSFVKFPVLDEVDEGHIAKALEHFFRKVGGDAKLQLSIKEYKKGGLRAQHEIKAKVSVLGKSFFADHTDWQLLETIQHTLKKLEKEVLKETGKK
jgi:ribosome-associated translation inhibitor RaiA